MNKNIALIGMPGSGKTTIGRLVAAKLNMTFVDMDEYIVEKEGKSINDMFIISEDYFRDNETQCARELSNKNNIIIATGGGVIKRKENIDYLKENSIVIFLNRPIENIVSDIDIETRPLLKNNIKRLYNLYEERLHLYKEYCDVEIINNKSIDCVVNKIVTSVNNNFII